MCKVQRKLPKVLLPAIRLRSKIEGGREGSAFTWCQAKVLLPGQLIGIITIDICQGRSWSALCALGCVSIDAEGDPSEIKSALS